MAPVMESKKRMQPPLATEQGCTKLTPRCIAWIDEVDGMRPACCTAHLKELLFCATDLLTEYGIVHWLDFGTLLGAVRHQAMITWDRDADISFLDSEPSLIPFLAQIFQEAGYCAEYKAHIPDELKIHYSPINHNHLDLYAYHRGDDGILRMRWAHNSENWFFPAHFLEQREVVTCYERRFLAPSPLHEFLRDYRYGPHYQIPMRFVGEVAYFFEPSDYTPAVARLLGELDRLLATKYQYRAQVQALARQDESVATLCSSPPVADHLASLVRNSYRWSAAERAGKLKPFWEALQRSKHLAKRVQRKYQATLPNEEITPAVYLLLQRIAQEKEELQCLQKILAVTNR